MSVKRYFELVEERDRVDEMQADLMEEQMVEREELDRKMETLQHRLDVLDAQVDALNYREQQITTKRRELYETMLAPWMWDEGFPFSLRRYLVGCNEEPWWRRAWLRPMSQSAGDGGFLSDCWQWTLNSKNGGRTGWGPKDKHVNLRKLREEAMAWADEILAEDYTLLDEATHQRTLNL